MKRETLIDLARHFRGMEMAMRHIREALEYELSTNPQDRRNGKESVTEEFQEQTRRA